MIVDGKFVPRLPGDRKGPAFLVSKQAIGLEGRDASLGALVLIPVRFLRAHSGDDKIRTGLSHVVDQPLQCWPAPEDMAAFVYA